MNEENSESVEESSSPTAMFQSPVLNHFLVHHPKAMPTEDFACQHCPNAIWLFQKPEMMLVCFCREMNYVTWTGKQKSYTAMCDGMWAGREEE